jgi:hypothetical protein
MSPQIRRQVLECASPLALSTTAERRRAAAVQDAVAYANVVGGWSPGPVWTGGEQLARLRSQGKTLQ